MTIGTVEQRVLDISSRKLVGDMNSETEDIPERDTLIGRNFDQSETEGLQQHIGRLLERKGAGEVVKKDDLWTCLFGNAQQRQMQQLAMKEISREQAAVAAESRRTVVRG
jgi:hypothetical protein